MQFQWHERLLIAGISIAGVFEGLQQASRDAPALNISLTGAWNYVPLAALSVGAVAWAWGRFVGPRHDPNTLITGPAPQSPTPKEHRLDPDTYAQLLLYGGVALFVVVIMTIVIVAAHWPMPK